LLQLQNDDDDDDDDNDAAENVTPCDLFHTNYASEFLNEPFRPTCIFEVTQVCRVSSGNLNIWQNCAI